MDLIKVPIFAALLCAASSLAWAQAPRTGPSSGKPHPNLNGIWQAVNEANWDLEGHGARPSPVVAMGALGAAPGGLGVVDGGAIPYLPAALAQRKENFAKRMELDPEVKCYLPGVPRATAGRSACRQVGRTDGVEHARHVPAERDRQRDRKPDDQDR